MRDEFDSAIRTTIARCHEIGYPPRILENMINRAHPVEVAKNLVRSGIQTGIRRLTTLGRQDLTVEAIMLEERFAPLFTESELETARWRLENVQAA